jgi:SnoaL-like domain
MRRSLVLHVAALVALPFSSAQPDDDTTTTLNCKPSIPSFGCPKISPGPVSTFFLADQLPAPTITDGISIEAIRQTLALYALAIDGRNYEALRKVFTPNVRANYSDPIGVLNGVQAIIDTLPPGLNNFASTQHLLGTQYIQICSLTSAVSVAYFQASHFFTPYTGVGNPIDNSQVLIDNAQYQDVWARQKDGTWKITNRNLVRMVRFRDSSGLEAHTDSFTYRVL